jgi:rhamnosyl/mannosyltransferase
VRVLQVNKLYHPWHGGIEQVAKDIAEGLQAHGWTTDVLVCMPRGRGREDRINGVRVIRTSALGMWLSMPLSPEFPLVFRRLCRRYDVILLHHPFPLGFLAHWLARPATPTAVWYHADIVRQRVSGAFFRPILRSVLDRSARVCVSSARLRNNSPALQPFRDRCSVVPFGVPLNRFAVTPEVARQVLCLRRRYGTPLLLVVGRLVPYKGHEVLLAAMEGVRASLVIVGDGPLRDKLKTVIRQRDLGHRVFLAGTVADTVPYLHACDVLVLPSVSHAETFGMVQVEAMACGKPVVNTALPTGVPEVSVDGLSGLTVPPGDVEALAAALRRLVSDAELRARMGAEGRRRAASAFAMDAFLQSVRRVLEEVSGTRHPAAGSPGSA